MSLRIWTKCDEDMECMWMWWRYKGLASPSDVLQWCLYDSKADGFILNNQSLKHSTVFLQSKSSWVLRKPRVSSSQASFDDLENIPYWYGNTKRLQKTFEDAIRFNHFFLNQAQLCWAYNCFRFAEKEEFNFDPNIRSRLYPEVVSYIFHINVCL